VFAAGMLSLLAAVLLAFLGRAVLATPAAVDRRVVDWPSRAHFAAQDRGLADRAAASLLAADRVDAFAQIAAIYRNALDFPAAAGEPRNAVRITDLLRNVHSPAERSQALVMAGRLLAFSAGAGFGVALPPHDQVATAPVVAQALEDFRAAIREDDDNETAKFDLELLLRQRAAAHAPPGAAKKKLTKKQATKQDKRRKTKSQSGEQHHAGIYATGSGY
jgi:Mg-chelatase subunit ChlI